MINKELTDYMIDVLNKIVRVSYFEQHIYEDKTVRQDYKTIEFRNTPAIMGKDEQGNIVELSPANNQYNNLISQINGNAIEVLMKNIIAL
jgi:hypothetical protein